MGDSTQFREKLSNLIPVNLIDRHILTAMVIRSRSSLMFEKTRGTAIKDLFMAENCLVTRCWTWDPETTSLHEFAQQQLGDHGLSQQVSRDIRKLIVQIGDMRLHQAHILGVQTRDLFIGHDLLPTWRERETRCQDVDNEYLSDRETVMDCDESVQDSDETLGSESRPDQDIHLGPLEPEDIPISFWSSDSESEDDISVDDEISLRNFVDSEPYIEESEDEAEPPNVLHDVDLLGVGFVLEPIDFEVFLADCSEDITTLPEVEIAIDENAYKYHYDDSEAIDVELVGENISCIVPEQEQERNEEKMRSVALDTDSEDADTDSEDADTEEENLEEPAAPKETQGAAENEWVMI